MIIQIICANFFICFLILKFKDSRGLIVADRPSGGISEHKAPFAHPHKPMTELEDIVDELKPTVLIGE